MDNQSFDLILIDGANEFNNRNECIKKSLSKLKKGGWIVLDNSDHPNNCQRVYIWTQNIIEYDLRDLHQWVCMSLKPVFGKKLIKKSLNYKYSLRLQKSLQN